MRTLGLLAVAFVLVAKCGADAAAEPLRPIAPTKVIKLFNGKDLSGWTTWLVDTRTTDPRKVYSVRNGMIRVSGDGFGYEYAVDGQEYEGDRYRFCPVKSQNRKDIEHASMGGGVGTASRSLPPTCRV